MKTKVRPTSLLAYVEILENLAERHREVYAALKKLRRANNTMIAKNGRSQK